MSRRVMWIAVVREGDYGPVRLTFEIRPTNLFAIELFAYTAAPDDQVAITI